MDQISGALLTIFGAIITLAIVSVFVGRNSKAPAVLQAASGGLAQVISAAVTPNAGGSANPAANVQASPTISTVTSLLPGLTGA